MQVEVKPANLFLEMLSRKTTSLHIIIDVILSTIIMAPTAFFILCCFVILVQLVKPLRNATITLVACTNFT